MSKFIIIGGPCALESYNHGIESAEYLNEVFSKYSVDYIFKTSFDKANRTSGESKRGSGLGILSLVFEELSLRGIQCLTDVHETHQVKQLEHLDKDLVTFQIPALLSRQTDLIKSVAEQGRKINIKKGQFMSPHDMKHAAAKAKGASEIWLTERGTTFGYNNLVVDYRNLVIMQKENPSAKVIFDCTHSTQLPAAQGASSGGQREFALPLAKAAVAVGCSGLFLETHQDPDNAPSDGSNMIPWRDLKQFMDEIMEIKQ